MAKGKGGFIGHDGLNAPDAPTGVSGTAGNTEVEVSFTSPSDVGGSAVTEYLVTDSTKAHTATGSSSPITVTGLTNETSYTFNVWAINAFGWSVASDASESVTPIQPNYGDRGIFGGGYRSQSGLRRNIIDYATITTTGNFTDFGDLAAAIDSVSGLSSGTRGVFAGGDEGSTTNRIQYITIASTGNASDFGDLTVARERMGGVSSTTRGVFGGGGFSYNTIDYITIASTGNAQDFGDISSARSGVAGASSLTRGLLIGGSTPPRNFIEYVTIASTGDSVDFGDLTGEHENATAYANGVTAMIGNDNDGASTKGRIESVTIATLGNSTSFGFLSTSEKMNSGSMVANSTRALATVGFSDVNSQSSQTVEYFTIASAGNGTDFGDLTTDRHQGLDCGLSGS